jgi:hypothetical protein
VSEQPGRYQRSAAGMVGAMLVLVGLLMAFVLIRGANRDDPPSPVRAVDYHSALEHARASAGFPLLAPPHLPPGWRATSVTFTPEPDAHWHLGLLTDQNRYIGLEQGDDPVRSMLTAYVDPDPAHGTDVTIDGRTWQSWSDSGGDQALVRRQGDTTTLVVGTVSRTVLADYVESLR